MVDWKAILTIVITALSGAAATFVGVVWRNHIAPWLEERGLYAAAMAVIRAIEAEFGRGGGESKLVAAENRMMERGYDVSDPYVRDAMKVAWLEMDMDQVASGVKESADYVTRSPVEVTDPPDVE